MLLEWYQFLHSHASIPVKIGDVRSVVTSVCCHSLRHVLCIDLRLNNDLLLCSFDLLVILPFGTTAAKLPLRTNSGYEVPLQVSHITGNSSRHICQHVCAERCAVQITILPSQVTPTTGLAAVKQLRPKAQEPCTTHHEEAAPKRSVSVEDIQMLTCQATPLSIRPLRSRSIKKFGRVQLQPMSRFAGKAHTLTLEATTLAGKPAGERSNTNADKFRSQIEQNRLLST